MNLDRSLVFRHGIDQPRFSPSSRHTPGSLRAGPFGIAPLNAFNHHEFQSDFRHEPIKKSLWSVPFGPAKGMRPAQLVSWSTWYNLRAIKTVFTILFTAHLNCASLRCGDDRIVKVGWGSRDDGRHRDCDR